MRQKVFLSIADQGLVSVFNFSLNIYLIWLWSPSDFGFFAVVAATAVFANMIQNAVVNTPLSVHYPLKNDDGERLKLFRSLFLINILLTVLLVVVTFLAVFFFFSSRDFLLAFATSAYIASQFLREYYRSALVVTGRFVKLLLLDVSYVLLAGLIIVFSHYFFIAVNKDLAVMLCVLGTGGFLGVVCFLKPKKLFFSSSIYFDVVEVLIAQRKEMQWSLLGVFTTDIQNRAYLFVGAAFFGTVAVAHLQAGRIFFGPLNLITGAWARVARPQLSAYLGSNKIDGFVRTLKNASWFFIGFNVLFLFALYISWPYLSEFVFGDKYRDLGQLVFAWGVVNLLFQIRSCIGTGVQALRKFRDLTLATIYGALVSISAVAAICFFGEANWLVLSVILGELVAIFMVFSILKQNINRISAS